jgi:hypothetical protein
MGPSLKTIPSFFSLAAQLPNYDVSGDEQTHLDAAQTKKFTCI